MQQSFGTPSGWHQERKASNQTECARTAIGPECLGGYRFRSNSDLCLTGYLWQMLPGVIAYGIQFDLNPYLGGISQKHQ